MWDFGLRMSDCACLPASAGRDFGCGIEDLEFGIWNLEFGILNLELRIEGLDLKS